MVNSCFVPGCTPRTRRGQAVSFHILPVRDSQRYKLWLRAIKHPRLTEDTSIDRLKNLRVCSRHFKDEDFESDVLGFWHKALKDTAVPSLFTFPGEHEQPRGPATKRARLQTPTTSAAALVSPEDKEKQSQPTSSSVVIIPVQKKFVRGGKNKVRSKYFHGKCSRCHREKRRRALQPFPFNRFAYVQIPLGNVISNPAGEVIPHPVEVIPHLVGEVIPHPAIKVIPHPVGEVIPHPVGEVIPNPAIKVIPHPVGEVIPHPVGEVIPHPAIKVIPHPVGEVIPHPVGEVIPNPAIKVIPHPVGEVIPHPAGEVIPHPAGEVIPHPAGEVIPHPAGEVIPHPVREVIPHPAGEVIRHPAGEVIPHSVGEVIPHLAGEVIPHPVGEVIPHPVGEVIPHPVGEVIPHPAGEVIPHPAGEVIPHPAGEVIPHPVREVIPHPAGEVIRHPAGEVIPHPVGEVIPHLAGEVIPHPVGEVIPHPVGEVIPHPAGEVIRHPVGEVIPHPAGEVIPHPVGEVIPHPAGEVIPHPAGEVTPVAAGSTQDADKKPEKTRPPYADHDYLHFPPSVEEQLEAARWEIAKLTQEKDSLMASRFCLQRFQDDAKLLTFYTGFQDYDTLKSVYLCLEPTAERLQRWSQDQTLMDQDQSVQETSTAAALKAENLTLIDQFFLFLCRVREGASEESLAERFHVSPSTVSRVVTTWANYLFFTLGSLPLWLRRSAVKQRMPRCFKDTYPRTRVILDCVEVRIKRASSKKVNPEKYSAYEGSSTLKGLIGVSPSGEITFVSSLHEGSNSAKEITKRSGILSLLEEGDEVMADKSFLISDLLSAIRVSLVSPPFLNQRRKFTKDEASVTQNNAKLRIHVERAKQRIKQYHIFDGVLPCSLLGVVNQLWYVRAMLANFQGPLS